MVSNFPGKRTFILWKFAKISLQNVKNRKGFAYQSLLPRRLRTRKLKKVKFQHLTCPLFANHRHVFQDLRVSFWDFRYPRCFWVSVIFTNTITIALKLLLTWKLTDIDPIYLILFFGQAEGNRPTPDSFCRIHLRINMMIETFATVQFKVSLD